MSVDAVFSCDQSPPLRLDAAAFAPRLPMLNLMFVFTSGTTPTFAPLLTVIRTLSLASSSSFSAAAAAAAGGGVLCFESMT